MQNTALSINRITIRLTDERWLHIVENHVELVGMKQTVLDTIREPDRIYVGNRGELLAISQIAYSRFLVAVYREHDLDGFVITAYITSRERQLEKRTLIWP